VNTATPTSAPRGFQSVWLVAEREVGSKLRSRAFVISTVITLLIALAAVIWGGFSAGNPSATQVAVTSATASAVEQVPGVEVTQVADREAAEALVRSGEVSAAVVEDTSTPVGMLIIAADSAPTMLVMGLSVSPPVELLEPATVDFALRYFVSIGFGIVFLLAASLFGGTIAQSVVEEKQTRVVELLLSAVPARALLAGKIIGNTILAMAQILLLAAIAVVGLIVTGQGAVLQGLGAPIAWFAVFFLFGFVLLAALFAAAGSLVSRMEDIGSTTAPLTMLIMAPYFLVIFFNDNPVVLTVMSYVPFSAPVGMPLRLYLGEAQWWEPILSLVILIATCVGAIMLAAKIYERSILRMGARVSWRDALKAA
jgi:ABC-2 type transport system permease protein